VDGVFEWTGDASILLAMVKYVEDQQNIDHDIEVAGVRAILVVEDSPRYYSTFFTVLYPELMRQSSSLFSEGLNRLQKLMFMRLRPKVLHAQTFEEALYLFRRYRSQILAIISDVGFPREDGLDPEAGLRLIRHVRASAPDLPILLQSSELEYARAEKELHVLFVHKHSTDLLLQIRRFLRDYLGFGPFIFRRPDGTEVGRARDTHELVARVQEVPADAIAYHCSHNHFSSWLRARAEFELADRLGALKLADFANPEVARETLLTELRSLHRSVRAGVITDFDRSEFHLDSRVQRLGSGSLGGKARGLAFLDHLFSEASPASRLTGMPVRIPQTFVLATSVFDAFMQEPGLQDVAYGSPDDAEVLARCLAAPLPGAIVADLARILKDVDYPLAIRSSSLLEDNMLHPFAGIYATVMLPNNDPVPGERLAQLVTAVKVVYASTFFRNARAYLASADKSSEEEKMAVVVQALVGRRFGRRFYPHLAGVAHSHNFYALHPQRPEDGLAQLVLGFGQLVLEGGAFVRFCPRLPSVMPQVVSPRQVVQSAQRQFYALDLDRPFELAAAVAGRELSLYDLDAAEADGTLRPAASTYNAQDDVITESRFARGPHVITFANILKHRRVPLAETLVTLLSRAREGMGTDVEIEFAADLGDWGQALAPGEALREPVLYPLQMRSVVTHSQAEPLAAEPIAPEAILCRSARALGHTQRFLTEDLVYVKPAAFDAAFTPTVAEQVGRVNERLAREGRRCVLLGPGRWGSSDRWLGIPVEWRQISCARVIVEASPGDFLVEPSQGTHFFHNLTSLGVGFFTIPPGARRDPAHLESFVDWEALDACPALGETEFVRHLRFEPPLVVTIDGRTRTGIVARQAGEGASP
jgi:hypothetical protein